MVTAIALLNVERDKVNSVAETLAGLAEISEVYSVSGIYDLVAIARNDNNLIAQRFLDWFVDEQFEEVTTMGEMLDVVERAGEENLLAVEEFLAREGKAPPAPEPDH